MTEMDKDKLIELFKEAAGKLATSLAQSHAYMHILISELEETRPKTNQILILEKAKRQLIKDQNAFLKEYSDWNEPGEN